MRRCGMGLMAAIGLAIGSPVAAQVIWDMPNVILKPPKFDGPTVQARPDAWPRLDPGAMLCRSEADLLRLAAFRRKEISDRPNCLVIRQATPIQIVKRAGPGRTQVALSEAADQSGWTDAWLPEKAPPLGGRGVTIR